MSGGGNLWVGLGAVLGFLGVALGAFGAHGLEGKVSERGLEIFHTGAQYQMYHALALVALGAWVNSVAGSAGAAPAAASTAGWTWLAGTVIFSGSLYALALTDIKILGAITPIGGVLFLVGWISVAIAAFRA